MRSSTVTALALLTTALIGCTEAHPTGSSASGPRSPSSALSAADANLSRHCADSPTFEVTTERELRDALLDARDQEGAVIAVDGMITLSKWLTLQPSMDELTLTCAAGGQSPDGLRVPDQREDTRLSPGQYFFQMILDKADSNTYRGLVLDERSENVRVGSTLHAANNGGPRRARATTFVHNVVRCEGDFTQCVWMPGVPDATIEGNRIVAHRIVNSGINVAGNYGTGDPDVRDGTPPQPADDAVIEDNALVAEAGLGTRPTSAPFHTAIRYRDGTGARIRGNRIGQKWATGIDATNADQAVVSSNRIDEAEFTGIVFEGYHDRTNFDYVRGSMVRDNQIGVVDGPGIEIAYACSNEFRDNAFELGANELAGILGTTTGGNFFESDGTDVDDNSGRIDCDSDPGVDPNVIINGRGTR